MTTSRSRALIAEFPQRPRTLTEGGALPKAYLEFTEFGSPRGAYAVMILSNGLSPDGREPQGWGSVDEEGFGVAGQYQATIITPQ